MIYDGMRFRVSRAVAFRNVTGSKYAEFYRRRDNKVLTGNYAGTSLMYGNDGRVYLALDGGVHISKGMDSRYAPRVAPQLKTYDVDITVSYRYRVEAIGVDEATQQALDEWENSCGTIRDLHETDTWTHTMATDRKKLIQSGKLP